MEHSGLVHHTHDFFHKKSTVALEYWVENEVVDIRVVIWLVDEVVDVFV